MGEKKLDLMVFDNTSELTGTGSAAQDRFRLQDLGFDEDEMLIVEHIQLGRVIVTTSAVTSNINSVFFAAHLNKSGTAGTIAKDDICFWSRYIEYEKGTGFGLFMDIEAPIPDDASIAIFDDFYITNVYATDDSTKYHVKIWYRKVKVSNARLRQEIELLRMAT